MLMFPYKCLKTIISSVVQDFSNKNVLLCLSRGKLRSKRIKNPPGSIMSES